MADCWKRRKRPVTVLVTGNLSLTCQQNFTGRRMAIVSLSAVGWPIIEPHVAKIVKAVAAVASGIFVRVECGVFVRGTRRRFETP